jgi:TonB family protein
MNPGWSLRDRTFLAALAFSALWHCFWFFSVSINVTMKKQPRVRPQIVSLGPVLDDSIFRTLAQTKPEISQTFYRKLSDFSKPADLEVKTIEKHSPGEVVSLPFGRKVLDSIKFVVGGEKASPDNEFSPRIGMGYIQETGVEGEVKDRLVLERPEPPRLPPGFQDALSSPEIIIDFTLDTDGVVSEAEVAASTGKPAIDLLWENYLRSWRFEPLKDTGAPVKQKGKIRFRVS